MRRSTTAAWVLVGLTGVAAAQEHAIDLTGEGGDDFGRWHLVDGLGGGTRLVSKFVGGRRRALPEADEIAQLLFEPLS